jgi:hypothetical protein
MLRDLNIIVNIFNIMFECKRCGYSSTKKCNIIRHLQSIKGCEPLLTNKDASCLLKEFMSRKKTYTCETCTASFSSSTSKASHTKVCDGEKTNEIKELIKTINDLKKEVGRLQSQQQQSGISIQGNNNTTIINNDNRIYINQFNKVETNYIENDIMKDLLGKRSFNHLYDSLKEVIGIVYYNEKHPENHSIFIPNIRERYARVFDGSSWVFKEKNEIITCMRNFGVELMRDFFYDHEHEFNMMQKQLLTKWGKSYVDDNNKPFDRKTREVVVETILSRQKIVKSTIDRYNLL